VLFKTEFVKNLEKSGTAIILDNPAAMKPLDIIFLFFIN